MKEKILKATHTGDLKIGDISLPCHILPGGIRVLSARGVNTAFGGSLGSPSGEKIGVRHLPRILAKSSVKPFISNDLMARLTNSIEFEPLRGGRSAFGYDAVLLPEICEVILDADKAGELKQPKQAQIAELLLRGFARVGIIALIDEATGYQDIRKRDALQKILEAYLRKELAAWAKRFPDEFYKEMFRLRGWPWNPASVSRPSVIGRYTNDLIYERLAPNILEELEQRNPKNESGHRTHRHHQWLTPDVGNPALAQHLHAVIGLMRAASNWEGFYRLLQRAFPKKHDQLPLLLKD